MESKRNVGIYVRVSTTNQVEDGYSIGEQTDKLRKFCDVKDWNVYKVYTDGGFSGSNIKRPGIELLIDDVKNHNINTVLVYKLDRLSRSQKDTLFMIEDIFNKNDCAFISLNENFDTSTAFGKAMVGILSVFAQLEREQITQRMQMGRVGRARNGLFNGSQVPIGYKYIDGQLIIDDLIAPVVEDIYHKYLDGWSLNKLLIYLNQGGHVGRELPWNFHSLRYVLTNKTYMGMVGYAKQWYKGQHKAIITKNDFDRVQKMLSDRAVKNGKLTNNPRPFRGKYLLSGLLRCGKCGSFFDVGISKNSKTREVVNRLYRCHMRNKYHLRLANLPESRRCTTSKSYSMDKLEQKVINRITKLSFDDQKLNKLLDRNGHKIQDPTPVLNRLADIEKEVSKIMDLYTIGNLPIDAINERSAKLAEEKNSLQTKLKNIEQEKANQDVIDFKKHIKQAPSVFETGTLEEKKIFINQIIKEIVLDENKMTIQWNFG
ncbi:recombinase family protein [Pediococcus pentosaceus]|uniref:recombinase family protein n=1 Tax=Pediococcus pentosaceus TaxID=1255 RepID=UPI001C7DEF32|nr:recombinase family protein [Pediococcus pentosaceus]QYY86137.1 recombinase family protein [Pediococcus pentosaceus]